MILVGRGVGEEVFFLKTRARRNLGALGRVAGGGLRATTTTAQLGYVYIYRCIHHIYLYIHIPIFCW